MSTPTNDEPLHHIERETLPWRPDARRTLCGRDATELPTWTRDEAKANARRLGRQRFSLFACMTCTSVFDLHVPWEESPAECVRGYLDRVGRWRVTDAAELERLNAEFRAIAMLIEAHRGEFDDAVNGLLGMVSLDEKRRRRAGGRS
jgi:hypothetical protein